MAQDYIVRLQGQDNLSSTIKNVKDELKSTSESVIQLDKIQKQFEKISTSSAPLKRQLRDLQAIMAQMNMNGLTNTAQFTEIAQYAGSVKDAIGDAQQAISKYSSDTATLDAVASGFQGISGAISFATGAMSLFGVENENVQQAILKVQGAMAMLNGVQAIANTLNKDSALMLKLKAIGLGTNSAATAANTVSETANSVATGANTASETLNTTAETANTVAKTANTAANSANTVATGANAASKAAQSAATASNTAATVAATSAQLANNAAVLANPYVLAAVAVAALTAGIVIWINSMDDATDSQIALSAAVDAFNEAADTEIKKCAESINLFNKLKNTYDNSGDKLDEFSKKLIANKEVQKKLGVVVKTVDDVHRLFANNTAAYQRAAIARASAMAAETAQATLLGSTLSELSQVYAKIQAGQEVNWKDMRKTVEAAGYSSEEADKLMRSTGFVYEKEGWAYGNVRAEAASFKQLLEEINKGGAMKALSDMGEAFKQSFSEINEIDFKGMLTSNFDVLADETEKVANKSGKSVKKETKEVGEEVKKIVEQTNDELKKVLSTLEGCDAVIQQAQKEMKNLDKNSADYGENLEKIKNVIFAAKVAKLAIIDQNTLNGLSDAKKAVQDIINDLPQGSKDLEKWQNYLKQLNEKSYEFAQSMAGSNSLSDLKKVQTSIDTIINELPQGSEDLEKWVKLWAEVNKKITDANNHIDDLKKGIEDGSVKKMQDEIKELQDQLNNKKLDVNARIKIQNSIDQLQREVERTTKGQASIEIPVKPTFITSGSNEDLRQSYANANTMIQQIQDDFKIGLIGTREEAIAKVAEINEELAKIGLKPIEVHIETNFEQWANAFSEGLSGLTSVTSAVDSFQTLTQSIEDGASAWDIFKNSISAVQSVLGAITGVMTSVNTIQELFNITKTHTAAISATEASSATAAAVAQQGKVASDANSIGTTIALTTALKAQEAAYLNLAAAAIFAAHSYIPFAGVGIATGFITTMMASMLAQHAASVAMMAFKDGGIVGGSSFYGDKVVARLNSGEMVLNRRQQTNLFNAIDNGMLDNVTNGSPTTISFKLKGSDIYGSLHNFTSIKSKSSSIKVI